MHFSFGAYLINILKEENPEFFDEELVEYIKHYARKSYEVEKSITNWIFQEKDLDFLSRDQVNEYIKFRLNISLKEIGIDPIFDIDEKLIEASDFFENSLSSTLHQDFFDNRPTTYSKKMKSISSDDLF